MAGKLLNLLALHPWIDADQAAALVGCSRQWAMQCLGRLVADGLAQACRVSGLCTAGSLYALTTKGSRETLVPEYVTRGFVTDALLRIEALWGTRNLLAMLARREELLACASPVRERWRDLRRPFILDMAARGVALKDGRQVPFVIVWDIGEVVTRAFEPTFIGMHRNGQFQPGYGPFIPPVCIVVTINPRRALQLVELWCRSADSARATLLPCYVGVWDEVASGKRADVWFRPGGEAAGVPLFHGVNGVEQAPMVPMAARRVNMNVACNSLVRAHLDIPDQRTREVLRRVAPWPLLTSDELALMLDQHHRSVQASLKRLRELELVETYAVENRLEYYLAPAGLQLLAAACGQSPIRYARLRHWSITRGKTPRLNLSALLSSPTHTREVRAFFVSLAQLAAHCRRDLALYHVLVAWDGEMESRRYYAFGGRRWVLSPDASGTYQVGDRLYEFLLEIDRGTESRPRLMRKLNNYYAYMRSGEFRRDSLSMPQLLIIVPDEARARTVRSVIIDGARLYGCEPLPAWIVVKDALDARGAGAPVWREITRWQFEHCFEGLASPPESARMMLNLAQVRQEVAKANRLRARGKNRGKTQ